VSKVPLAPGANVLPVTDAYDQAHLYGPVTRKELAWTCPTGLTTETHTWYTLLENGAFATSQIIYSPVGLWNPQVQMTFKYFDPKTGRKVWKSKNVSQFEVLEKDRCSCKSETFSVTLRDLPDGGQEYAIQASLDQDVQLLYTFTRPASAKGWTLGEGARGGHTYFGENLAAPDGYVMHRFWPYVRTSGLIVLDGQGIDAAGQGLYVRAIQGMRPNLVAARWNFVTFQSKDLGGTAATLMELTTTPDYGKPPAEANGDPARREPQVITFGSVTCNGHLVAVVGATRSARQPEDTPSAHSATRITHQQRAYDAETGYQAPQAIHYHWDGPALSQGDKVEAAPNTRVTAEVTTQLGEPDKMTGLIDKVDVLAEIPYFVRKMVNYVAGTKPYIYQTMQSDVQMRLSLPSSILREAGHSVEGDEPTAQFDVTGSLFEEHTFISELH